MVEAVRRGRSLRAVARQFGVSLATVQGWVARAADHRLDHVAWGDRAAGCRPAANRVTGETEEWILSVRRALQERSMLGEYGAVAIQRELRQQRSPSVPSIRTIGRVLERRGALDDFYALRRRDPSQQLLLQSFTYHRSYRRFYE